MERRGRRRRGKDQSEDSSVVSPRLASPRLLEAASSSSSSIRSHQPRLHLYHRGAIRPFSSRRAPPIRAAMAKNSPPKHRHDGTSPLPLGMDWSPPPKRWVRAPPPHPPSISAPCYVVDAADDKILGFPCESCSRLGEFELSVRVW